MAHEVSEAEDYLSKVGERFAARGVEVEKVVAHGEPVREIIRQAKERKPDLVAMSTHGHKGLYDFVFGSVADEVRHELSIPVLLIRSGA